MAELSVNSKFSRKHYTVSLHESKGKSHYDLFLENGDALNAWRISAPPETGCVTVEKICDHRKKYLEYEGEISEGRGKVTIHSQGHYRLFESLLTLEDGKSSGIYLFKKNLLIDPRKSTKKLEDYSDKF